MPQDPTEYDNSANAEGKMSYRERLHKQLKCSYCPPNKVENRNRGCQHYKNKKNWKYQNKHKKQYERGTETQSKPNAPNWRRYIQENKSS